MAKTKTLDLQSNTNKNTGDSHLHFTLGSKKKITRKPKKRRRKRRFKIPRWLSISFYIGIVFLIILGIAAYFYVLIPLRNVQDSVETIQGEASALSDELDNKDLTNLDTRVETIRSELDKIQTEIDQYAFLGELSFTARYYENLETIGIITEKVDVLIDTSLPEFKGVLEKTGFSVQAVVPTAEDTEEKSAISLVLTEMPQYLALYEKTEPQILDIFAEVRKIDTEYISPFGLIDLGIKQDLEEFQQFTLEYPVIADKTTEFLAYVPELIGAEDPTDYLIILQNEAEMRSSGGLLTSYGHMSIEGGELKDDIFLSDMWNLNNFLQYDLGVLVGPEDPTQYTFETLPDYISPYGYYYQNIYGQLTMMLNGCGATALRAQDAGIYPDLEFTMSIFADYYDIANLYDKEQFPDYEHVVILNETFASDLIGIIEPLEIEEVGQVTSENLFNFIRSEVDKPELAFSDERKAIIEDIANAAKEKFYDLEFKDVPRVFDLIVNGIYAKDFSMLSEKNPEIQSFFNEYGLTGRIAEEFDGDYFHLNEAQNCALKINNFMRNSVTQNIYIAPDGNISKTVDVDWWQPKVYDPAQEFQYTLNPRYSYRAWVRLFTPPGTIDETAAVNFDSDGFQQSGYLGYFPQEYYDIPMNKDVSDNLIQFDHRRLSEDDPVPTHSLSVSYALAQDLNYESRGNQYKMLLQKHPGKSWGEEYTLVFHYDGRQYETTFTLNRDKVVTFENGIISIQNYNTELDWLAKLVDQLPLEDL